MEEMPRDEMLRAEKELLGFYLTGHPLDEYTEEMNAYATHTPGTVMQYRGAQMAAVAATVDAVKYRDSPRGRMAFVTLSGVSDSCEATIWADALERCGSRLESGKPLLIQGRVQNGRGEARFCVERIDPLDELRRLSGVRVRVRVTGNGASNIIFSRMLDLLRQHPGRMPVFVEMDCGLTGRFYVGESRSIRVEPDRKLLTGLRELLGDSATVSLYLGGGTR